MQGLIEKLKQYNPRALSKAISAAENDPFRAESAFSDLFTQISGDNFVIGITGAPGVGKSTLIKNLIEKAVAENLKIAVLAVDPSSPFSGGAFLGDRLRINIPNFDPQKIFIRSLATRGNLGGLSPGAAISLNLLKYYKYDIILIETAGVGQSEVDIMNFADCVAVLLVAGLGDEIQAMKSGIMEIADVFVVNKCNAPGTDKLVNEVHRTILNSPRYDDDKILKPEIILTDSVSAEGVDKLWQFFKDCKRS